MGRGIGHRYQNNRIGMIIMFFLERMTLAGDDKDEILTAGYPLVPKMKVLRDLGMIRFDAFSPKNPAVSTS